MFTTATPPAQEFNIENNAATPPRLAPYPTLVGTAITGLPNRPATTLGSAPSIPATTIRISAALDTRALSDQAMNAGHAHVEQSFHRVARQLGGQGRLLGDGDVAGPGADHGDGPGAGAVDRRHRSDHDDARDRDDGAPPGPRRARAATTDDRLGGDAGGQGGRAATRQLDQDGGDLLPGLAEAQHHLGEPGAQVAMGVGTGESQVAEGELTQLADGLIHRPAVRAHLGEQRLQSVRIHRAKITSARRDRHQPRRITSASSSSRNPSPSR